VRRLTTAEGSGPPSHRRAILSFRLGIVFPPSYFSRNSFTQLAPRNLFHFYSRAIFFFAVEIVLLPNYIVLSFYGYYGEGRKDITTFPLYQVCL